MATWASLSQSDKDAISDELKAVREWCGMAARLANLGRAIASKHAGNVETILQGLDAGTIPVYDAAQGEQQLTKQELIDLAGYGITYSDPTDGASGSYNSNYHRAKFVKAAGLYNTLQAGKG